MMEINTKRESKRGVHMAAMRAECGGQAGFDEAKERGDVWCEQNKAGKWLWYSTSYEEHHDSTVKETTKVHGGQRKLSRKDAEVLRSVSLSNI
jgi:hypothetical protein